MEPEIIKGIPRDAVIKQLLFYTFLGSVLILGAEKFLLPFIHTYVAIPDKTEALFRFRLVMAGLGLAFAPLILYLLNQARRIAASRQFPPPGTIVWKDTPIVRGRAAFLRAWVMVFLALVILGLAICAQFLPQPIFSKTPEPQNSTVAETHPSR